MLYIIYDHYSSNEFRPQKQKEQNINNFILKNYTKNHVFILSRFLMIRDSY